MGINNIQITPVNVYWAQAQSTQIDFTGLTGASLGGKYFTIYPANSGQGDYVFFDTGSSVDPAPNGLNKITLTILSTDTATQVATKLATLMTAQTGKYIGSSTGAVVVIKRAAVGDTKVSTTGGNTTGATITLLRRGRNVDLGLLEGDVELSFEPSNFEVKAHQTGVTPRAAIFQGLSTLECKTTLLETGASQLQLFYNVYGGTFTSTAGNTLYGVGSAAQGKNLLTEAGRLVLKPVNATDDSQNFTMMAAIPVPGSLTFSGENPRKLAITWKGFIDQDFNSSANAICVGDIAGL